MPTPQSAAVMMPFLLAGFLGLGLTACSGETAPQPPATRFVPDTKPAPPVRWVDAVVPEGTRLELQIETVAAGGAGGQSTPVRAKLVEAVLVGNIVVLPAGSLLEGEARRSAPGSGIHVMRFGQISTPTGAGAPIAVRPAGGGREVRGSLSAGTSLSVELEKPLEIKVKS